MKDAARSSWALSPRTVRLALTLLLTAAIVLAGALITPPYVVMRAGPAVNTLGDLQGTPIIEVKDAKTYPTEGSLDFTTVAQYGGPGFEVNLWFLLSSLLDADSQIVPRDQVFPPDLTLDELQGATSAQMAGSQSSAEAVVFQKLGYDQQAVVASVVPGGPAANVLREGDRIRWVGDTEITRASQVSEVVRKATAGAPLTLGIERGGVPSSVKITPTSQEGRTVIGVGLTAEFPKAPTVAIHAGDVGGPSAGMMFALGIYDKLTPGPLTGGHAIAGTGTMALDGAVGPIGGIEHKMNGAQEDDVEWFLAPAENCPDVVGNIPDGLSVAKISTFDEAVHAVEAIAAGTGNTLPTCG